jgi:hypothetical protein
MRLYRVVAPHFVAGFESDGVVRRAAPILGYSVGWSELRAMNYFRKKGWQIMGYAFCTSACFGCGRTFSYNPIHVPSIRHHGERQPICRLCVDIVNPRRIANGLNPIVPHPEAYEPCDEDELP